MTRDQAIRFWRRGAEYFALLGCRALLDGDSELARTYARRAVAADKRMILAMLRRPPAKVVEARDVDWFGEGGVA